MYKVYRNEDPICEADTLEGAVKYVDEHIKLTGEECGYVRFWKKDKAIKIDYGSHKFFYYIRKDDEEGITDQELEDYMNE